MKNSLGNKNVLVCTSLIGFISGFLIEDINYLRNKECNVICCANSAHQRSEESKKALEKNNINFIDAPFSSSNPFAKSNIKAFLILRKIFKKYAIDLVIVHTPISGFLCRLAFRKYFNKGSKVIYVTHGFPFSGDQFSFKMKIFYILEKMASKWSNLIITINKEDYNFAKEFNTCNVEYVPGYGVNIEKFKFCNVNPEIFKKRLGLNNDSIVLTSIGELSPRKNHISVLKAINKSRYKKQIVYFIAGGIMHNKNSKDILIEYAKEHSIKLKLLGFISNVEDYLHISNIGILPSLIEGFGFAGIETIASGVPLLGNSNKGIKDYIINGVNGYLVNINDDSELASKIDLLIENPIPVDSKTIEHFSKIEAQRIRFKIFDSFI